MIGWQLKGVADSFDTWRNMTGQANDAVGIRWKTIGPFDDADKWWKMRCSFTPGSNLSRTRREIGGFQSAFLVKVGRLVIGFFNAQF